MGLYTSIKHDDSRSTKSKRQKEAGAIQSDAPATKAVVLVRPFGQTHSEIRSKKKRRENKRDGNELNLPTSDRNLKKVP